MILLVFNCSCLLFYFIDAFVAVSHEQFNNFVTVSTYSTIIHVTNAVLNRAFCLFC